MSLHPRSVRPVPQPSFLLLPLLLLLPLAPACDDDGTGSVTDGGARPDGAAPVGDGPPTSAACPTLVPGSTLKDLMEMDQTLRGVVAVNGEVRILSGKITIEAGTTFVMGPDASLEFGWNSGAGSLFARGTAAAPIRFCGKLTQAGYWRTVTVGRRITSDSVLEHVSFSDGGQQTGAALELEAPVLVKDVEVVRSGADGVHASDFKAGSERLTVSGAAKLAVVLTAQGGASRLPLGGSYTGNGTNMVALRFDAIDVDTTFRDPGVPYLQETLIRTLAPTKITFEAGVDYRLAVDQNLDLAWNGNATTVIANGTAAKPVLFGRASDSAGGYGSIILREAVRSDSVLRYVKVRGGGNGNVPALDIRAPLTIDHLSLEANQTGLRVQGAGFSAQSTALTITTTAAGPPARVEPDSAVTLPTGGAFTGNNTSDWIAIEGGDFAAVGTLRDLGVPYRVEGGIRTLGASALTVEAGTVIQMAADTWIEFGWNSNEATVTAVGTAARPIVWKGVNDTTGYWAGLLVDSNVRSTSKFAYVQILNGGKADGAALGLRRIFDVTNTKFARSSGYGIRRPSDDVTDYAGGGNTFEMNTLGTIGAW